MSQSGTFTPVGNTPALTRAEEMKLEKARQSLINHTDFSRVFDENYRTDTRFKDAVDAVLAGRSPRLVLEEYPSRPKDGEKFPRPTDGGIGAFT
jgi:hypothetical protein